MMRSMTLLTSTVAITIMASDSTVVASSSSNDAQQQQQHQQLWYPDFASDYESGSCTTSPTPAVVAFAAGGAVPTTLAQNDKESCCETWFPDQELCGCLGGCDDENDTAASSSGVDAAPTQASSSISAELTLPESHKYWYPQFDVTYEQGKCVKAGVNNNEVGPPSYYTKEGGFLHLTLDACCDQWFEHQEGDHCLNALSNDVVEQPMAGVDNNMTSSSTLSAAEKVVVEPVRYQASRSPALTAEESL